MKYTEIEGNLIDLAKAGEFDLITHGCNCLKNWGAGIALSMKGNFPLAFKTDQKMDIPSLGKISICKDYSFDIVNIYSQYYPGQSSVKYDYPDDRYNALRSAFKQINTAYKGKHIGIPLIGCGYGGLTWEKVSVIIKTFLPDLDITIVIFK